jgi:hypothetical protein
MASAREIERERLRKKIAAQSRAGQNITRHQNSNLIYFWGVSSPREFQSARLADAPREREGAANADRMQI